MIHFELRREFVPNLPPLFFPFTLSNKVTPTKTLLIILNPFVLPIAEVEVVLFYFETSTSP
jgi:hypothetical protein